MSLKSPFAVLTNQLSTISVVLAAMFLVACSEDNWENDIFPPEYGVIVPGEQMFGAKIGDDFEVLRAPLSRQDLFIIDSPLPGYFYTQWDQHGVVAVVRDINNNGTLDFSDPIASLLAFDPYGGRTVESIGRGSNRTQIEAAFGVNYQERLNGLSWDYLELGITFNFFFDTVAEVEVYPPNTGPLVPF